MENDNVSVETQEQVTIPVGGTEVIANDLEFEAVKETSATESKDSDTSSQGDSSLGNEDVVTEVERDIFYDAETIEVKAEAPADVKSVISEFAKKFGLTGEFESVDAVIEALAEVETVDSAVDSNPQAKVLADVLNGTSAEIGEHYIRENAASMGLITERQIQAKIDEMSTEPSATNDDITELEEFGESKKAAYQKQLADIRTAEANKATSFKEEVVNIRKGVEKAIDEFTIKGFEDKPNALKRVVSEIKEDVLSGQYKERVIGDNTAKLTPKQIAENAFWTNPKLREPYVNAMLKRAAEGGIDEFIKKELLNKQTNIGSQKLDKLPTNTVLVDEPEWAN